MLITLKLCLTRSAELKLSALKKSPLTMGLTYFVFSEKLLVNVPVLAVLLNETSHRLMEIKEGYFEHK